MFGRQDISADDDTAQLDDQQAAYMTDLTATSGDSDVVSEQNSLTPTPLATPFANLSSPSSSPAPLVTQSAPAIDEFSDDAPEEVPVMDSVNGINHDELLDIKQSALNELSPLVDHLDQTPEEKFRTTMMLIQASDNANLVQQAYNAAREITDDKARAQALLDIVNEINYFTNRTHTN